MAAIKIFVSFEFDKDQELKNTFFCQAKDNSPYRVHNSSLNECYPTDTWKRKAQAAIRECDIVIVLVGQDTHNAQGVIVEVDMARSFGKPVFQVVSKSRRAYRGLHYIDNPIRWNWKRINKKIDELTN